MKKITSIKIIFLLFFSFNLSATNFIYTGTGSWNNIANWTPSIPVKNPGYNIYNGDSITINGNCTIDATEFLNLAQDITYIVNGTLINNYVTSYTIIMGTVKISTTGSFINNGNIEMPNGPLANDGMPYNNFINEGSLVNNGTLNIQLINTNNILTNYGNWQNNGMINTYGSITNNGSLTNHGEIYSLANYQYFNADSGKMVTGFVDAIFINNGLLDSYGMIEADYSFTNNSKIISHSGGVSSGRYITNTDTIIGSTFTSGVDNYGVVSPGFSDWDTDTMKFIYGVGGSGSIIMEINGPNDNDVIGLAYGEVLPSALENMIIKINPNYTPSITDSFVLAYAENAGPSPLKPIRSAISLPPAPLGYFWKIVQNQTSAILTLDFVLPINITQLSFNAIKKQQSMELYWNVKALENITHFEVEHSINGIDFEKIGEAIAKENVLAYSFSDKSPAKSINYYRLKAVDIDGQYVNSNVINVDFSTIQPEIQNTIVEDDLWINSVNTQTISIFNNNGQIVFSKEIEEGIISLNLNNLSLGNYFVHTKKGIYKILKK